MTEGGKTAVRRSTKMRLRPRADFIMAVREEADDISKGGIVVPDTSKEKPLEGRVVAIGPGRRNDSGKRLETEVKEGDRILMAKYAGSEVNVGGTEHVFVREEDVLAIIEG
jgi:chaperonin GroES